MLFFSMDAALRSWLSKLQNLTRGLQGFDDWPYMELGFQEHFRCHGGAAEQGVNWKLSLSFILNFICDLMTHKDKMRFDALLSDWFRFFVWIRESSYILWILQVLFALAALVILVRFISNLASGPNKSPIILRNNFSQFLVYFKIISKSHLLTFFSKFWSISNKSPIKNAITAILMQTSPRWRLRMCLTIL